MDLDFISSGQQFEPVSSFMKGRAMRMAYEADKAMVEAGKQRQAMAERAQQFGMNMRMAELARDQQVAQAEEATRRATAARDQLLEIEMSDDPVRAAQAYAKARGGSIANQAGNISAQSVRDTVGAMRRRVEAMAGLSPRDIGGARGASGDGDRAPYYAPVMSSSGEYLYPRRDRPVLEPTGVMGPKSAAGYETEATGRGRITEEATKAKLNITQKGVLSQSAWTFRSASDRLVRIRDIIAKGPETGWVSGKLRALVEADMQVLRSIVASEMLSNMRVAREAGVPFGQVTVAEWEMIARAGITLDNLKSANLRILDRLISEMSISEQTARDRLKDAGPAFSTPPIDAPQSSEDEWESVGNAQRR